ncbi:hypothetical protein BBF96_07495 [Anoxybacter fermentans]|uniref:Uncharacterized protein n=1 Tax=Anoxybacter fermentans TaxID=1323375 RepID=A0A3Q9HQG3_9FIRM|nr:tetratricopeptide repeat protein [Anoxybacter fermentans]AZR73242.1 hypothetical protein BBF96_07495 [Anoxybacter fermentans]
MRGKFIPVVLILILLGTGFTFNSWQNELTRGNKELARGQLEKAIEAYRQALVDAPDEPVVHYNLGHVLYKKEDFAGAEDHFKKVLNLSKDKELQNRAEYNLGNTVYRQGEAFLKENPLEAINKFETALQHYQNVIKANPKDKDAKFNYEFVKKKLKELKDQMEKNREQNQNKEQNQKNKQNQYDHQGQKDQKNQNDQKKEQLKNQQNSHNNQQNSKKEESQDTQLQNEDSKDQSKQDKESVGANQKEEAEEKQEFIPMQGLTKEEVLKLLEQFKNQNGEFIPIQLYQDKSQYSTDKDW